MLSMNEIVDLRMQQQIAHEIYRQQIMQRIPDPFPTLLPLPGLPHHMIMPPRPTLPPGVEAKLENDDLWQQFHHIGTEMIITKSGRRMFPSMRVSVSGLEEESNYCVLLEMVPIGDCRFKFSGSQWVPAGGAEPQSPQRMFLHPDSPATGAHWQSQAILFNKVKLTNNTLDSSGHIVLASMHKYQPRLHFIRTNDLTQLPWAPQQAFVFPETEFVAVTAYQNDRITKLKIDNNPFAKGFRETGQSRCKRKINTVGLHNESGGGGSGGEEHVANSSHSISDADDEQQQQHQQQSAKRLMRSNGSLDDEGCFSSSSSSSSGHSIGSISPRMEEYAMQQQQQQHHLTPTAHHFYAHHANQHLQHHQQHHHHHGGHHHHHHHHQQQQAHHQHAQLHHPVMLRSMDLAAAAAAAAYFAPPPPPHELSSGAHPAATALAAAAAAAAVAQQQHQHQQQHIMLPPAYALYSAASMRHDAADYAVDDEDNDEDDGADVNEEETEIDVASRSPSPPPPPPPPPPAPSSVPTPPPQQQPQQQQQQPQPQPPTQTKRNSFSISAILAY